MITRAFTIFAIACLAGAIHLVALGKPISLTRESAVVLSVQEQVPEQVPENDPYARFAGNALFDASVLPTHITLRQAYRFFEDGATFLDARHGFEYEEAHVAGAIWMAASRLSDGTGIPEAYEIDASMPVVIYCTGGECDASENTAVLLESLNLGFEIHILGMGYDEWAAVGLPIEGSAIDNGSTTP